jgi:ELWxxDGT repeat protein
VGNFVLIAGAGDAALGGTQRGEELYRFDLTTGANELVRDIRPGADGSSPVGFRAVGDTVYFMAAQAQGDFELWRSDGTAQGTRLVAEINAGGASYPGGLTNIGPTLYFHAKGPAGREVYRSDGTPAGTTVLRDIQAGTGSGLDSNAALVASGGRIFFAATNSPARLGARLYVSDGTTAGTVELGDVAANQPGNAPQEIIAAPDGAVLFSGWSPDAGRELWYSDGTDAGTLRVDDLAPGSRSANPIELTIVGEQLYLSADDSVRGREAYRLDLAALEFSQIFRDGFE